MDKVPSDYITGKQLEELVGIPNLSVKAKELMYPPRTDSRQKNLFGEFYKKNLKAKYFNIGQGGLYGTLHYKKPNKVQIQKIKDYHLRKGAKYGLTDNTIKLMKKFYNDPTLRKYIRKGEFVPDEILKQKDISLNQAANVTFRLAQHLNGKKFANVDVDIPVNKLTAKKLFKKIEKAPFGNPYQLTAYKEAQNIITNELGKNYFNNTNLETMKREARRVLNREGIPTYNPTVKGSTGFNVNELIGIKTGARVKGMAPYSQFMNVMEGKLNTQQYGNFVRQFEKFANRMQTENKADVIKDYNKYKKRFLKNNPGVTNMDLPGLSLKSPEKVYGTKRITSLANQGLDLNRSFKDIGYTVDAGKTMTLKEFTNKELFQNSPLRQKLIESGRKGEEICKIFRNKGGRIGYASGTSCAGQVADAFDKNPQKFVQEVNKTEGVAAKIKNSSTKFLTALKENPNILRGSLGSKVALGLGTVAAGVGAGALVKAFKNDDPSTYLTNDSQMEGMIIADVEDKGKEVDDNILLDNQFKLELAGAAGLTAPIAKSVYQKARASTPPLLESPLEFDKELKTLKRTIRQITHPKGKKAKTISQAGQEVLRNSRIRVNQINEAMSAAKAGKEGSGIFRSALGLEKGVLGKGLWALGAPAIAVPATIGYIAQDIRAGKDAGEIATNPLNYLGAAFMNPAVKALTKAGASRGLLGIASLGLAGTAAGAVALPAISIGAGLATLGTLGYQGYKLFSGNNKSDEDFFR